MVVLIKHHGKSNLVIFRNGTFGRWLGHGDFPLLRELSALYIGCRQWFQYFKPFCLPPTRCCKRGQTWSTNFPQTLNLWSWSCFTWLELFQTPKQAFSHKSLPHLLRLRHFRALLHSMATSFAGLFFDSWRDTTVLGECLLHHSQVPIPMPHHLSGHFGHPSYSSQSQSACSTLLLHSRLVGLAQWLLAELFSKGMEEK